MIKSNNTNGLLSSRLKNSARKSDDTRAQVDLSQMRHKDSNDEALPTYRAEKRNDIKRQSKKSSPKAQESHASPTSEPVDDEMKDAARFDEEIDFEGYQAAAKEGRNAIIGARLSKIALIVTVALCIYFSFLIYGVAQTNYIYDSTGAVVPEILSVSDLRTLNQYNELSSYFLRTRILYEKVLKIDYHLAEKPEESAAVARDYLGLLDEVSKLSTDIKAAQLDIEYTGIINRMYSLVYTHIAVYLQNMNSALEGNNTDRANQALQGREVIMSEFALLTENMAALCKTTAGARNADVFDWSPQSYMESLKGDDIQ